MGRPRQSCADGKVKPRNAKASVPEAAKLN